MPWIAKVEYDDKDRTKTKWILETEQFGQKLQFFFWTAKDLEPVEYERIAWKSEDGLRNRGSVTFKEVGNNNTKIEMMIEYEVPAVLETSRRTCQPARWFNNRERLGKVRRICSESRETVIKKVIERHVLLLLLLL